MVGRYINCDLLAAALSPKGKRLRERYRTLFFYPRIIFYQQIRGLRNVR
jgi:hypothetical protein